MCQFISYFYPLQIHIGSFFLFIEYATYIVFSAPFSEINVYLCRATWRSHTPACLRSTAWRARKRQTRSTQIISPGKTLYVFLTLSYMVLSLCFPLYFPLFLISFYLLYHCSTYSLYLSLLIPLYIPFPFPVPILKFCIEFLDWKPVAGFPPFPRLSGTKMQRTTKPCCIYIYVCM